MSHINNILPTLCTVNFGTHFIIGIRYSVNATSFFITKVQFAANTPAKLQMGLNTELNWAYYSSGQTTC